MPAGSRRSRISQLLALSLGHALNDGFVNFVAPLWPHIKERFILTNSDIGMITFWWGVTTNFSQPIFGYFTDRKQPRHLIVAATLISTLFFSFVGYARTLPEFLACIILGGMGVAIYHPRAGALAVAVSGSKRALGMGLFSAGGALGYAVGYLGSPYLHNLKGDMTGLAYAAPVGVLGALVLLWVNAERRVSKPSEPFSLRKGILPYLGKLSPIMAVMVLRSATVVAFGNFIPLMLSEYGRDLVAGGHAGFYFIAGGALGGIAGGHISDRIGRRGITIVSLLMSPPLLYLALHTATQPSLGPFLALLFLAGFVMRSAEATNITHTQELLPKGASVAASIGMGGAWGIAGLIGPAVGKVADEYGVAYALAWIVWVPALAALAAFFIPKGSTHRG